MRRGTPGALELGRLLRELRLEERMSMRQVASVLGAPAATVSQIEKGERALKEDKIEIWAKALRIDPEWLRKEWLKAEELEAPPIVRRRPKAITEKEINELVRLLSGSEKERVRGYIEGILSSKEA